MKQRIESLQAKGQTPAEHAQPDQKSEDSVDSHSGQEMKTMAEGKAEVPWEALFSFTSKSFDVFIETQNPKQRECLSLIKNAYELLLKLSIDQMVTQNESLRHQVKKLLRQK